MYTDKDPVLKLVIVGDSEVGKSNLASQFSRGEFKLGEKPTIGVEYATRSIDIEGRKVDLQVWDTAGQEKFSKISNPFYRSAVGALIVFDLTKAESFDHVVKWKRDILENSDAEIKFLLVGNKVDLKNLRSVLVEDIDFVCESEGLKYIETSALTNYNVENAFKVIVKDIMTSLGTKVLNDHLETHSNSDGGFRLSQKDKQNTNGCTC